MNPGITFFLLLLLGGSYCGCSSVQPIGKATQRKLEQMARTYSHFSLEVVVSNRPLRLYAPESPRDSSLVAEQLRLWTELRALSGDRKRLKGLLTNSDPKVRTLALGAVFQREDGHDLPLIATLIDDSAQTFPDLHESPGSGGGLRPMSELERPQTVGVVAQEMLSFWGVEHEGLTLLHGGGGGIVSSNDFAQYWVKHKDRNYCAGWFAAKLARAGRREDPIRKEYVPDIRNVRRQIDELPADDKAWTLLWLSGEWGAEALVTEQELLQACKELGPQRLMLMLQGTIPSTDPDFQARYSPNSRYGLLTWFVLHHAGQLLNPDAANNLLTCQIREENATNITKLVTPWWAIAAAHLQPQISGETLHAAFNHFNGRNGYFAAMRSDLAVALWELRGQREMKFLADWFYQEIPSEGPWWTRGRFIENVSNSDPPTARKLISCLVLDPRFENIVWDPASLQSLANVINTWLVGKPPIPAQLESLRASVPQWDK